MNFYLLLPEIALTILALVVIVADLLTSDKSKSWLGYLAAIGLVVPAILVVVVGQSPGVAFTQTFVVDPLSGFFQLIFLFTAALVLLSSVDFVHRRSRYPGEFFATLLFATLGAMFLASGNELITIYVALELMSISQYILAGFIKGDKQSAEAGMKYLLLGALASAVLLYGIALVYAATGTTTLAGIRAVLASSPPTALAVAGMVLIVAGFGFKISAVPFQMWVPDVYQGAPTPVTAFLSVVSKAAGFVAILRVVGFGLEPLGAVWPVLFAILAVLTMTVGNLMALRQTNIKRLMGYSSIGQAGYALTALAAFTQSTTSALLFFLLAYAVTNVGTFIAIIYFGNRLGSDDLSAYDGLSRRAPVAAFALTICLLSLVGMPPMVGFWSKVYLFLSVYNAGMVGLVVVGLLNSALAAFYYLKIVHAMYLKPVAGDKSLAPPRAEAFALLIAVAGVFLAGLIPGPFIQAATAAAQALFPS